MSVYQRKDSGKWIADIVYTDPVTGRQKRIRRMPVKNTRAEAMKLHGQLQAALADGSYRQRGVELVTFEAAAADYLEHAQGRLAGSTHAEYSSIVSHHLVPAWGALPCEDITTRDVHRLLAKLQSQGRTPARLNRVLTVVRQILSLAIEWGERVELPRVKRYRERPTPGRYLSADECERLLAAASGVYVPMIGVALHTGLRLGELRALQWDAVDVAARVLTVRRAAWRDTIALPKHSKERTVPLSSEALGVLERMERPVEWVFPGHDGELLKLHTSRQALARVARRAKVGKVGWHTLRRTCATHMCGAMGDVRVVQAILGHASVTTTMRYAQLLEDATRAGVESLCGTIAAQPTRAHLEIVQ